MNKLELTWNNLGRLKGNARSFLNEIGKILSILTVQETIIYLNLTEKH